EPQDIGPPNPAMPVTRMNRHFPSREGLYPRSFTPQEPRRGHFECDGELRFFARSKQTVSKFFAPQQCRFSHIRPGIPTVLAFVTSKLRERNPHVSSSLPF